MSFEFVTPRTVEQALELWNEHAAWFAGGTDLLTLMNGELARPLRLVNLKGLQEFRGIHADERGLAILPLTTLAEIADDPQVRAEYRALAESCEASASPQLRNAATLGGNLAQDSRCPYYRGAFDCWLKGGDICYMRQGETREAAVTGYAECVHVHPSDPANALVALGARIRVRGRGGEREVEAEQFWRAPAGEDRRMQALEPGELITEIRLPRRGSTASSTYIKAMDRASWSFALVSAAICLEQVEGRIGAAHVILGGAAPIPWRAREVESYLTGQTLSPEVAARAAGALDLGSGGFEGNHYKQRLARGLVKKGLLALAGPGG